MVQQIGEGAFKTKAEPLGDMKVLGESGGDRGGARAFEDANAAISNRTLRNRIEGTDIEHAAGYGIRDVAIAEAVGTLEGTAIGKIEVSRIVARTGRRREIRTRFPQTDGADRPPA
jgi:hypothetical protein